jgi:hypothetical protein
MEAPTASASVSAEKASSMRVAGKGREIGLTKSLEGGNDFVRVRFRPVD